MTSWALRSATRPMSATPMVSQPSGTSDVCAAPSLAPEQPSAPRNPVANLPAQRYLSGSPSCNAHFPTPARRSRTGAGNGRARRSQAGSSRPRPRAIALPENQSVARQAKAGSLMACQARNVAAAGVLYLALGGTCRARCVVAPSRISHIWHHPGITLASRRVERMASYIAQRLRNSICSSWMRRARPG